MTHRPLLTLLLLMILGAAHGGPAAIAQTPLPIAEFQRDTPVSFEDEIVPILQKNCLACHSASEANGQLVLETAADMLKGGDSGPAIVPGKGAESLLLKVTSHAEEPLMPPPDNDVAATNLTPQQLGLLKLWIDQGARSTGIAGLFSPQQWRPLPPGDNPIYSVAVTPDGQFAAVGRANQIFIYHVPTGRLVTRLNDPDLQTAGADQRPGIAHLDIVQSLAFNEQGDRLASGGFRTAKIWHSPRDVQRFSIAASAAAATALAVSPDRQWIALGGADGSIKLVRAADGTAGPELAGHTDAISALGFSHDSTRLYSASLDRTLLIWDLNQGVSLGRIATAEPMRALTTVREPLPGPLPAVEAEQPTEAQPTPFQERLVTAGGNHLDVWQVPAALPAPLPEALPAARCMAVSPDGRYLALADDQGAVQVHDSQAGTVLNRWQASESGIGAMVFLPTVDSLPAEPATGQLETAASPSDSSGEMQLATTGKEGRIQIWDVATGELQRTLHGSLAPIQALAARPDGKALAAGNESGQITQWNLAPPAAKPLPASGSPAHVAVLSLDGKLLATAETVAGRPAILVRDLAADKLVATLLGHEAPIAALSFNADATRIVSGSEDQTVRVWDPREAKFPQLARFDEHASAVHAVAFNADATQVLSGANDGSLKLWSVVESTLLMDFAGHTAPISGVALLAGTQPVSASSDKTIRFWNTADGKALRSLAEPAAVTALAATGDSQRLAVAVGAEVKLYQASDGKLLATLGGHTAEVSTLRFSADHTRLMSASAAAAAVHRTADGRLLEIVSGPDSITAATLNNTGDAIYLGSARGSLEVRPLQFGQSLEGLEQRITALIYRNDNQALFTASADGTVRGFNLTNGQTLFNANHAAPVHDLALSPDQQTLASAGDTKVKLWNAANGAAAQPAELTGVAGPIHSVCFAAEGSKLVAATGGTEPMVTVHTRSDGAIEQVLRGEGITEQIALLGGTPAAGHILGLSATGSTTLWQLLHRQRVAGHTGPVTSLAPVAEMQVLSGSLDGTVRHWDLSAANLLLRQLNHGAPVTAVAAHPAAERFVSVSENSTARLWNMANGQQLAEMKGDLRAKELVAKATLQRTDWTAKVAAATTALEAERREVPLKTEAEKVAATALASAKTDVAAKQAELTKTVAAKVQAEKAAIEAAAAAQASALRMRAANEEALLLVTKVGRMNEKAVQARAIAQTNADNEQLAKLAEQAAAELAALQELAKAAETAKLKPTQEADAAAKVADSAAQVVVQMTRPYADAAAALSAAQDMLRITSQAHEIAVRDLEQAQAAVPQAEQQLAAANTALAQAEADLATALGAEQQAQQPLRTVAFSPDGRTLATAGDFPAVHTWSAESGKAVSSYAGHAEGITALAYISADSLVSSATDQQTIVWDANPAWELERVIGSLADPTLLIDRVAAVDFNQAGTLLATGGGVPSRSGEVKIWKVADGSLLHAMPEAHTDGVNAVAFSADDAFLASASADKLIKKWDVASGEQLLQLEGHTEHVLGVDWRSNGQMLASAGGDATVRIWDATNGDRLREIGGYNKQVTDLRFVGQSQFVVAVSGDPLVRMHNTDNGGTQRNYGGAQDYMYAVDVTPDGSIVVAGGHDGVLRIWDGNNGQVLHSLSAPTIESAEVAAAKEATAP